MKYLSDRRARLAVAAVVAAALFPALSATSAYASITVADSPSPDCNAGAGANARGGPQRDPVQTHTAIETPDAPDRAQNFGATVHVQFHVVTNGTVGSVTNAQIGTQIKVLNNTYAGGEGGPNTGFTFTLAGIDRTNNKTWFNAGPDTAAESAMKRALHKGTRTTLNLYSTSGNAYLGWATFPTQNPSKLFLDGVVMNWESMKGTSTTFAGQYDQGETATHETGHWLNLYHVFQGGCSNPGDHVADTPKQATATSGCPAGQDSCPNSPGLDSIHNYMDYSYDQCYTRFTAGQVQRMHNAWLNIRL